MRVLLGIVQTSLPLLFLSTGSTSASASKAPPSVAATWTGVYTVGGEEHKMVYDLPSERFYFSIAQSGMGSRKFPALGNLVRNGAINVWEVTKDGMCFPQDDQVFDWKTLLHIYGFGWLAGATWKESRTVEGSACEVWALEDPTKYVWEACLTSEGIPLQYTVRPDPREVGSTIAPLLTIEVNFTRWSSKVDPADLEQSPECGRWPPAPCKGGAVRELSVYRACDTCLEHPSDEDAGDVTGDLFFVCMATTNQSFLAARNFIRYDLMVNQSFGPYRLYNYAANKKHAIGSKGLGNLVGKSFVGGACSEFPRSKDCGQCSNNLFGSWYSLPGEGLCGAGQQVGADGCTWATLSRSMKEMACLVERMRTPCTELLNIIGGNSTKPPDYIKLLLLMVRLRGLLTAATASEAKGGCPEVPLLGDMETLVV